MEFESLRGIKIELDVFYEQLKQNSIEITNQDRQCAQHILNNIEIVYYREMSWVRHKNMRVNLAETEGLILDYPFETDSDWSLFLNNHLEKLKSFCQKLLMVDREAIGYDTSFRIVNDIPDTSTLKRLTKNFMENSRAFERLLINKLAETEYVNWTGEIEELRYLIDLLTRKGLITIRHQKQWQFGAAYFLLKGKQFMPQEIKDARNLSNIQRDRNLQLDGIISSLL